jgi:phosphoglycerate dehydrogenase-like enzyme
MNAPRAQITICHDGLVGPLLERVRVASATWADVVALPEATAPEIYRAEVLRSDVVVGWPKPEWLLESRVRFYQCGSTGYEAYAGRGLETKLGFTMSNSAGTMSIPVAEHGIALMLAGTRQLHRHAQDQARRHFERYPPYREVRGTTACVCGLGGIGTEIARLCLGLGMNVVGVRQHADRPHPLVREIFPLARLADAVRAADHVFIVLPLTAETRGCFHAAIFAAMKRGAAIYALARGAHLVEADLIAVLESGQVGFAGLDVFRQEPLPADSAWWRAPNVLITPHASGRSVHEHERVCDLVVDNLARLHAGRPLRNVVMPSS